MEYCGASPSARDTHQVRLRGFSSGCPAVLHGATLYVSRSGRVVHPQEHRKASLRSLRGVLAAYSEEGSRIEPSASTMNWGFQATSQR